MAISAILMQLRQFAGRAGGFFRILLLVLMHVMAEMLNRSALLVLTIDGCSAPGKLERHHN